MVYYQSTNSHPSHTIYRYNSSLALAASSSFVLKIGHIKNLQIIRVDNNMCFDFFIFILALSPLLVPSSVPTAEAGEYHWEQTKKALSARDQEHQAGSTCYGRAP